MHEPNAPADIDLSALFALDDPPVHDADFVLAVAQRVARRQLAVELGGAAVTASVSAVVLWGLGPVLAPLAKPLGDAALLFAPPAAVAAALLILFHPRVLTSA